MLLKLVAIDVETGNFVFQEVSEGLPAGVDGNVFVNEGGVWATKGKLSILLNASELRYIFSSPSTMSTRRTAIIVTKDSYGSQLLLNTGNYPNAQLYGVSDYNGLFLAQDADSYLQIASHSIANIFEWKLSSVMQFSIKRSNGTIFSNSLTANTYLGANANKEIVSIQSPNQIKYVLEDRTSTDALVWQDAAITLNVEANVVYELTLNLVFGNIAGRNGRLKIVSPNFIYKPIVTGNVNSVSDSQIIMRNTADVKPESLSVGEEYSFQLTGYQSSYIEMRGIFISTVPDPALRLEFKTDDDTMPLVLKAYSYLKLSR